MRTVCVEAEQKNAKQNNRSWLEGLLTVREYQNFLEEGKLVVGVASVACVVSRRCPIFMIFGILQEYCRKLQVLPDTFMYTTFSRISGRTKNGPSAKTSGRGTGGHVESGRGIAVICTRGWSPVSSARVLASNGSGDEATRVLARSAIRDERAYALRP